MAEGFDDYDDTRYQHHLQHRGVANQRIFWMTWTLITFLGIAKSIQRVSAWWIRRRHRRSGLLRQSKSNTCIRRATATLAIAYSLPVPDWLCIFLPNLTLGRFAVLVVYITSTSLLLTAVDAPVLSQHYLDDVAYRAAWTTLTQIPLVYLLSTKRGPINLIGGLSYERINWLHRWVARILFCGATTHMAIMKSSIATGDILRSADKGMSIVRYGVGAYATLIWIVITSILPVRRWSHFLFYINHYIATIGFLLIVLQHVPSYASSAIHLAVSFLAIDKALVTYDFLRKNFSVKTVKRGLARLRRRGGRGMLVVGYQVEMIAPTLSVLGLATPTQEVTTIIRMLGVPITWKPGQHIRLYIPSLGAFEMHPFTPANCSALPPPPLPPRKDVEEHSGRVFTAPAAPVQRSDMLLMIRAQSGLTQRLATYYSEWLANPCPNATQTQSNLIGYVDGPYGIPPTWEQYENLVLIATSTGVSFILSVMDHLEQLCFSNTLSLSTQSVCFIWSTRHADPHLENTVTNLLLRYSTMLRASGISVTAEFYTTCPGSQEAPEMAQYDPFAHLRRPSPVRRAKKPPLRIRNPDEIYDEWDREAEKEFMHLKQVDPYVTELYASERSSFESGEFSEVDTSVDGDEVHVLEDNSFMDAYAMEEQDDAYRPLPLAGPPQRKAHFANNTETDTCQCALIQHQRRKLQSNTRSVDFIDRNYGVRPDVPHLIAEAASHSGAERTMVAVCGNDSIAGQARQKVGSLNKAFILRRRRTMIDIFVEGMR